MEKWKKDGEEFTRKQLKKMCQEQLKKIVGKPIDVNVRKALENGFSRKYGLK